MNFRSRRLIGAIITTIFASLLAVVPLAEIASAQTAFTTPRYVRTIGGAGRPGVFSWGVEYNPVTNEVLVSDYLNFKIRRYDLQGNHLGDFWRDNAAGQPYTVAVDPNSGAIYVAELKDNPLTVAIAKYDKNGNFLSSIPVRFSAGPRGTPPTTPQTSIRAFYTVWMTVEEDTGDLFLLDSHYNITDDYRPYVLQLGWNDPVAPSTNATVNVRNWFEINPPDLPNPCNNPAGCVPRLYGIDITDDDVIYMSDAWNTRAYRYSKTGTWLSTFGQNQLGGDNRGVVVNEALDRVYIVDAENSQIDMFTEAGNFVSSFSSEGNGPGQFAGGGREADIDADGNLWVGDFGGFETEKFTPTGTPLLRAPIPPRKPPLGLLGQPRDVAVDDQTGEVWVADAWNQRFVRFSATGAHMGTWGARGPGGPFNMNYPRSIAIDPVSRRIWIANERGHHIQVYNYPTSATASPTYVRQIGQIGRDDIEPNHFRWPVDIEFYTQPGGRRVAVIGDRMASSVKMYDANTYAEITKPVDPDPTDPENPMIPVSNHGTAIDPATGNIYVVNPSSDRIEVYNQTGDPVNVATDTAGNPTNRFGSSGTGNGQMRDPVDAVISQNRLYVADETNSRVTVFGLNGTYIGRWGSTYGANIYDFKGAIGIDADAQGKIYVTDTANDRIQVFDPNLGRQWETTPPPVPTVTAPAQSTTPMSLAPVQFTGAATDNNAVGFVEVAVQDYKTGKWWNAANQSWETAQTFANAGWSGANASSVAWNWTFLGVSTGGQYVAQIRTRDHNANVSGFVMRTFAMPGQTVPPVPPAPGSDSVRPDGIQLTPTANQTVPRAPLTFSGTATDNVGVTAVRIAVKNTVTGRYLSSTGMNGSSFGTTFVWHTATLGTPGGTSTNWSITWTPSSTFSGCTCQTLVEARDASGNVDGSKPQVNFTMTNLPPDTTAPDTVLSAPTDASTLTARPVIISGSATDDQNVAGVRLTITNGNGLYWSSGGWSSNPATVDATLGTGTTSRTWEYGFDPGGNGNFTVTAAAVDAGTLVDQTPAGPVGFTIDAPAEDDIVPPNGTVSVPTANQVFPAGQQVVFAGQATDNVGVANVQVAIRNRSNLLWLQPNGTWSSTFRWLDGAVLDNPNGLSTGWSYPWLTQPAGNGIYLIQVRARDAALNVDPTRPSVNFSIA